MSTIIKNWRMFKNISGSTSFKAWRKLSGGSINDANLPDSLAGYDCLVGCLEAFSFLSSAFCFFYSSQLYQLVILASNYWGPIIWSISSDIFCEFGNSLYVKFLFYCKHFHNKNEKACWSPHFCYLYQWFLGNEISHIALGLCFR